MTKPPSQTLTGDLGAAASLRPETDEELAFCRRWAHERSLTLCQTWLPLAVGFHLLVAGIISFVTQFADVPRWLFGFHLLAAVTTCVFWWRARESHYSPHYFLGMMVTIIAAYSFYLYQEILRGEEIALPAFALVGVAGTFVILTPMIDVRYVVGKAVTYVVMGVSVWLVSGGGKWADTGVIWTLAYVVNIGLAAAIQILRVLRCDTEAVREFRARAAIREAERHRQEVELAVAKEIQDSFAPAPLELEGSGLRAFCYQKKYAPLGGDWLAVRRMDDGSLIAIVADATGKGVQASLVVHAVQSLWASALGESTFDPATWLRHLNRVLLTMGRTRLQTVTIGLLQIDRDRVTYWSAGHVPAFVVSGQGGDRELHRLVGRGSLLGMEENPPLEPVSFSLQGLSDPQILIGSDGVFDAGTLTRKSYVFSLLDHLEFRGEGPWSLCRAEDDKILIWIRQTAGEGVLANAS